MIVLHAGIVESNKNLVDFKNYIFLKARQLLEQNVRACIS